CDVGGAVAEQPVQGCDYPECRRHPASNVRRDATTVLSVCDGVELGRCCIGSRHRFLDRSSAYPPPHDWFPLPPGTSVLKTGRSAPPASVNLWTATRPATSPARIARPAPARARPARAGR